MADDITTDPIPSDLHWVHAFPVGVGGVAPGGRAYRFNGGELDPWPFSRVDGLTWVREGRAVEHPGLSLGWPYEGRNGQFHTMGLHLKGFPLGLRVAVVDDVAAAMALARRAVEPTGSPTLLREWSPALVRTTESTLLALQFSAWDDNGEVQFRHELMQRAGVRHVLTFLSGPLPLEMVGGDEHLTHLLVRTPGGHVRAKLAGRAHESVLEPCEWVQGAVVDDPGAA